MKRALLIILAICLLNVTANSQTITQFFPASGPQLIQVTIAGSGFSTTLAANTVKFNGVVATVKTATAAQLVVAVPLAATTGKITVSVNGGPDVVSASDYVVTNGPGIVDFVPKQGQVGTVVTINGINFNGITAASIRFFNGISVAVFNATSSQIVTQVPPGAISGPITINLPGQIATSPIDFTVNTPPVITSFNPPSGLAGTPVTITGLNFLLVKDLNHVNFNGVTAFVSAATTTSISTFVPAGVTTGPISITAGGQTGTSATDFIVPAVITSFDPTSGPSDATVTITGTNFSATPANNTVKFNGTTAVVTASTTTSITTNVPAGATTGPVTVTVSGITATSGSNFTVTVPPVVPTITGFNPTSGSAGTTITITGTNFSTTPSDNAITFNGTAATVITSTATSITASVPAAATSGPISVTVNSQTATSSTNFTVTIPVVDITPPVLSGNNGDAIVTDGQPVIITLSITDPESGVTSANLLYRYISSDRNFTALPMNHTSGQTYSQTIPASASNELGIEYKFDITNGAGLKNIETLQRVRVAMPGNGLGIPYSAAGGEVSNYRIIAIPLELQDNLVGDIFDIFNGFGAFDNTMWRMWHYSNGQNSELDFSSTIAPGNGYWLIHRTHTGAIYSGTGTTVAATLDHPFEIDLKAGWNQIGNPYNFVLNWADVQANNPDLPGLRKYIDTFIDATSLDKMEGGFVHVPADRRITIPVLKDKSLNNGRIAVDSRVDENPLDQKNWEVHLHLTHGSMRNEIGGFGMNEKASEDLDVYDGVTAPRFFGKWLEINHAPQGKTPVLSNDVVPTAEDHVWQFEIATSESDPTMELIWDNSYFGNNGHELVLWDNARQYAVNMRTVNSYTFDAKTSGSFKVIFGSASFVNPLVQVKDFALRTVSPNPAMKEGEVTIALSVPDADAAMPVTIEVIDALGKKIWAYENFLPAGNQEVKWKLNGEEAAGLYIVKAKHGSSTAFSRVILKGV